MTINTNNILNNLQINLSSLSGENKIDDKNNVTDQMINDNLQSDMLQSQQQILNLNNDIGYSQVADRTLSNISDQTNQLNTLSIAKNNGILSNEQKSSINSQMTDISNNISKTINETTYNGKNVFDGKFSSNSLNISNQNSILEFQKNINNSRSDISSFMNSTNSNIDNLSKQLVNEANSKSNYEPDIAKKSIEIQKDTLNLNASTLAQSHNSDMLANSIQELLS